MHGPFSLEVMDFQLRSASIGMQDNVRSELAERWDLEALSLLDFEQMLLSEQTRQAHRVGRDQFDG